MAFQNLVAGDVVRFTVPTIGGPRDAFQYRTASVIRMLTFPHHVVVNYGACGHVVDARNFVRVVRSARDSKPHSQRGTLAATILNTGPL